MSFSIVSKRAATAAVFTLILAFNAPEAPAQTSDCSARLSSVSDVAFNRYDPFDGQRAVEQDTLAITRTQTGGECVYALVFASAGSFGERVLDGLKGDLVFTILPSPSAAQPLPVATEPVIGASISATLEDGQARQEVPVFFTVPAGQVAAAGTYEGGAEVRLFLRQSGRTPLLLDRAVVSLTARVEERAAVNLALQPQGFSAGRTNAEIDFGELDEGEIERIFVQVRSTTDYRVSIRSDGRGRLVLDQAGREDFVPYEARFEGTMLNLSGTGFEPALAGSGPTSGRGVAHELEITIGDISRRSAGDYTDTLTIRVDSVR